MLRERSQTWCDRGGTGPWFDVVHFDVHGMVDGGQAYLKFLSRSGRRPLAISADKAAMLLREHQVHSVVLSSCESAKVTGYENSNLARTFVSTGIRYVAAMSYKFTASAAEDFSRAFYGVLLRDPRRNLPMALSYARQYLMLNMSRKGGFGLTVQLEDYIVPVLYTDGYTTDFRQGEILEDTSSLSPRHDQLQPNSLAFEQFRRQLLMDRFSEIWDFIGREKEILEIESLLLRKAETNIIHLYGMAGVGKSALARFLAWWWIETGLVQQSLVFTMEPESQKLFRKLLQDSKIRESMVVSLRNKRNLLLIDGLHELTGPAVEQNLSLSSTEKSAFRSFIKELEGGKSLIIVIARRQNFFLDLPLSQFYGLRGFEYRQAESFASRIIYEEGRLVIGADKEGSRYLDLLIRQLNSNPRAITAALKSLGTSSKWRPDCTKLLYREIQQGATFLADKDVAEFITTMVAHIDRLRSLWLFAFAPLWGVFREDWFDEVAPFMFATAACDETHPTPSELSEFIITYVVGSGWMEIIEGYAQGQLRYFRINPIYSNALRIVLKWPDKGDSCGKIFSKYRPMWSGLFYRHYCERLLRIEAGLLQEVRLEHNNFVSALDTVIHEIPRGEPDEPRLHLVIEVFNRLWSNAYSKMALPNDSELYLRGSALVSYMKDILTGKTCSTVPFLGAFLNICLCLAEYHTIRLADHKIALREGNKFNNIANSILVQARKELLKLPPDLVLIETRLLINQGQMLKYQGNQEKAVECFIQATNTSLGTTEPPYTHAKAIFDYMAYSMLFTNNPAGSAAALYDQGRRSAFEAFSAGSGTNGFLTSFMPTFRLIESQMMGLRDGRITSPKESLVNEVRNSELFSGGVSAMPLHYAAKSLLESGRWEDAKVMHLQGIRQALAEKDLSGEHILQSSLASMYLDRKDWATAVCHIRRITEIEEVTPPVSVLPLDAFSTALRHFKFGTAFWRLLIPNESLRHYFKALMALRNGPGGVPDPKIEEFSLKITKEGLRYFAFTLAAFSWGFMGGDRFELLTKEEVEMFTSQAYGVLQTFITTTDAMRLLNECDRQLSR